MVNPDFDTFLIEFLESRSMGLGLTLKSIIRSLFDERTPKKQKIIALLSLIYTLSPVDVIADTIVGLGILDDGFLLTASLLYLRYKIPNQVYKEKKENYEENPGLGMGKILFLGLIGWVGFIAIVLWAIFGN